MTTSSIPNVRPHGTFDIARDNIATIEKEDAASSVFNKPR